MDLAIMIEGQNGLNWPRWQKLALAVEELGFAGLYRSDHYVNPSLPDLDSLELWVSLTWLATHTTRIDFGPLVTPVSFRHPTMTARMAAAVDDLSGGRLALGLGAGWMAREHLNYGWDLLDVPRRMDRFEEGLLIITRLLRDGCPVDYAGAYFRVHDAVLLPRPQRPGGPPILIGGNGQRRTLPLAAAYADEWNGVFLNPGAFAELSQKLDGLLASWSRPRESVRRSLMTTCLFGRDEQALRHKLQGRSDSIAELQHHGIAAGAGNQFLDQLARWAEAGVQRIMLQWLDLDDLDNLHALAETALPWFT
jgi:F420-dependent oxidoreductase-like protein